VIEESASHGRRKKIVQRRLKISRVFEKSLNLYRKRSQGSHDVTAD